MYLYVWAIPLDNDTSLQWKVGRAFDYGGAVTEGTGKAK